MFDNFENLTEEQKDIIYERITYKMMKKQGFKMMFVELLKTVLAIFPDFLMSFTEVYVECMDELQAAADESQREA